MKYYLIEIREKGVIPKIFIEEMESRQVLKCYLNINWNAKKYKIRVFIIKECIIDSITHLKENKT